MKTVATGEDCSPVVDAWHGRHARQFQPGQATHYNAQSLATILVSYGDDDGGAHASRLRRSILEEMSDVHVLMEHASDRSDASRKVVDHVDLILGIIGPPRLSPSESVSPNDLEDGVVTLLREAVGRRIPIIPILIRGAALPALLNLPSLPGDLTSVSPVELRHDRWGKDVRIIIGAAERLLADLAAHPRKAEERIHVPLAASATVARAIELLRRRYIPHDRTWRVVLRTAAVLCGLSLLTVAGVAYWWHASAPVRQVELLSRRVAEAGALDAAKTALDDLQRVVDAAQDPAIGNLAVHRLKGILLDKSAGGVNRRQIRLVALAGILGLRRNDISRDFAAAELTNVDLGGARLSGVILRGVSLRRARLVSAVLDRADLSGSDLSAAAISHASVHGAKFAGADFTELDWFNAAGFTNSQLSSVVRTTLEPCPSDAADVHSVEAFERGFDLEYAGRYEALSKSLQDWLSRVWERYRASGGMCEVVDRLLRSSR
jgi:uncharacterized protein YjbI with pentapeptide repeats